MSLHVTTALTRIRGLFWAACIMVAGCSSERANETSERAHEKLLSTERAAQPAVSAFECGAGGIQSAIASCRAAGGHYGHCAVLASRAGMTDATNCYTYASQIHARRERLVGQEDQLDAQISYLEDVNAATLQLNAELNSKVGEMSARTDTAIDSVAEGQMTQAELAQLHAIVDAEVSAAQRQLAAATGELRASAQYRSRVGTPTAALDAEILRLQALVNETQSETSALVAQRGRI